MLGFFKVKKHEPRGFNYQPRYYNQEKEALQDRINSAKNKQNPNGEATKHRIREELRRAKTLSRRQHKGLWNGSTMRMLLILVILCGAAYVALNQWLPGLLNYWFPSHP